MTEQVIWGNADMNDSC